MTIQQLLDTLNKIEDKSLPITVSKFDDYGVQLKPLQYVNQTNVQKLVNGSLYESNLPTGFCAIVVG